MAVLAALGPIGAALIAYAIATTPPAPRATARCSTSGRSSGSAYFFAAPRAVLIVAWIGVLVQGAALIYSTRRARPLDRRDGVGRRSWPWWCSVLSERNQRLVARRAARGALDKLTGVLNRRGFEEQAAIEVERARREDYRWPRSRSTSTTSSASTTSGATTPATACSSASARVLRAETRAHATSSRGWAARSSWRSCRAPTPTRGEAYAERVRAAFAAMRDRPGRRPGHGQRRA